MCNDVKGILNLVETYKSKLKTYDYSAKYVESIINSVDNLNRDNYLLEDYVSLINSLMNYAHNIQIFDKDNFNRLKEFCISLEVEFNAKRGKCSSK